MKYWMTGVDEGQRDSLGGRCCLLSRLQRHSLRRQRGECPSLDPIAGPDDTAQHSWHQGPARDSRRPRDHFWIHAGSLRSLIICTPSPQSKLF